MTKEVMVSIKGLQFDQSADSCLLYTSDAADE